jgi:hypothetical protein
MKDLHACLSRAVLCAAVVNVAPAPSVSAQAGSRVYQPTKGPEAAAADHADRHVYPADVRDQPQLHAKDMVVWAGILKAHGVKEADAAATLVMTVEHRYYDWIEDFSQAPDGISSRRAARAPSRHPGRCLWRSPNGCLGTSTTATW